MTDLKLPETIATKTQLVNVYKNLETVLEKNIQNSVRAEEGVDFEDLPEVSSALAQIIRDNKIKVDTKSLKELKTWLDELKHIAPVVRFTFASDPENEVTARLVTWLRDKSGKEVLIRTSVQPSVAAGCLVHTPSHEYDFTLRQHLLDKVGLFSEILSKKLAESVQVPPETAVNP